ncbi:hypothetical protein H5410_055838 [Solanum commersonii]|uniref:Pectinesterase inhibitor domain-containing protein n=1 Tax=Solanum commersonii TaxID=4109 RepID=A0A9J5WKZ7_SOLCO|nr:hypothetical protein H5410_055838 [Solanum commersonii]
MVSELGKNKGITIYETAAIKDCIGDLKDAVYELKETLGAMNHLNDTDKDFQWDNAKTYASAVISDANSCLDGFSDRKPVGRDGMGQGEVRWNILNEMKREEIQSERWWVHPIPL